MTVTVKICGVKAPEALSAAVGAGEDYVGFVFYGPSPRYVTPAEAGALSRSLPPSVKKVAVSVDAEDGLLGEIIAQAAPDLLQLHGSETPDRVVYVKQRFKLPVMKALSIAGQDDVVEAHAFETCADLLLFDAQPPEGARDVLPGGNGLAFDWALIAAQRWKVPWLLSGGLTADNVQEAIGISGATAVDISSGVEASPGNKDPDLIRTFLKTAKRN